MVPRDSSFDLGALSLTIDTMNLASLESRLMNIYHSDVSS